MTTFTTQDRQDVQREPVAWMMVNRENTSAYLIFDKPTRDQKISHEPIPLYTKSKPLTEQEIYSIYLRVEADVMANKGKMFPVEIARAIERAHGIGE